MADDEECDDVGSDKGEDQDDVRMARAAKVPLSRKPTEGGDRSHVHNVGSMGPPPSRKQAEGDVRMIGTKVPPSRKQAESNQKRARTTADIVKWALDPAPFTGEDISGFIDHSKDAKVAIVALDALLGEVPLDIRRGDIVALLEKVMAEYCVPSVPGMVQTGDVQPLINALLAKIGKGGVVDDGSGTDATKTRLAALLEQQRSRLREITGSVTKIEAELADSSLYPEESDSLKSDLAYARSRVATTEGWIKKFEADIKDADTARIDPTEVTNLRRCLGDLRRGVYEGVVDFVLRQEKAYELLRDSILKQDAAR